jgi:hypothetical protein
MPQHKSSGRSEGAAGLVPTQHYMSAVRLGSHVQLALQLFKSSYWALALQDPVAVRNAVLSSNALSRS